MNPSKLNKVPIDQMRLGMHLHEMCGAWLNHPFWKTKFVLKSVCITTSQAWPLH